MFQNTVNGPLAAGMAQCQALLDTMEDLYEDSYCKVLEKLHADILWRSCMLIFFGGKCSWICLRKGEKTSDNFVFMFIYVYSGS